MPSPKNDDMKHLQTSDKLPERRIENHRKRLSKSNSVTSSNKKSIQFVSVSLYSPAQGTRGVSRDPSSTHCYQISTFRLL